MKRPIARLAAATGLVFTTLINIVGPAHAEAPTLHAVVSVWPMTDATAPDPSSTDTPNLIGFNPTEAADDLNGATAQVASTGAQATVVTVMRNMIGSVDGRLVGVIYWNPVTNLFKWYGVVDAGYSAGVDVNRSAPARVGQACPVTSPDCFFMSPTFQPGDAWASVSGAIDTAQTSIYVQFKGTNNFRKYQLVNASGVVSTVNGIAVNQQTGAVYFTEESSGTINRLDPVTNTVTTWMVGGVPHYLKIDPAGAVYATVANSTVAGNGDSIVRLDPTSGQATAWTLPQPTNSFQPLPISASQDTPDGIDLDGRGDVWFIESQTNTVGRLEPSTNTITEFTKPEVQDPQQIAATGQGGSLQVYFTEGDRGDGNGESLSLVTPQHTGTTVVPKVTVIPPTTTTVIIHDESITPKSSTIIPTQTDIPATDPEITRFSPMPAPVPGDPSMPRHPAGLTDVMLNGVLGTYLDPFFAGNSAVFRVVVQSTQGQNGGPGPETGVQKVTGGGWIPVAGTANHNKANFGFQVQQKDGQPVKGHLEFNNQSTGEKVHSDVITSLVITGNTATFNGTGRNAAGMPCSFQVTVQDNGRNGQFDTFQIQGTCASAGPSTLGGGNIVIHQKS